MTGDARNSGALRLLRIHREESDEQLLSFFSPDLEGGWPSCPATCTELLHIGSMHVHQTERRRRNDFALRLQPERHRCCCDRRAARDRRGATFNAGGTLSVGDRLVVAGGTLAMTAGTTSTIAGPVTNSGIIDVRAGTLDLTGAVTNGGTIKGRWNRPTRMGGAHALRGRITHRAGAGGSMGIVPAPG
jgi:hypothetical protein